VLSSAFAASCMEPPTCVARSNTTLSVRSIAATRFAGCEMHSVRLPNGNTVDNWVWFVERAHVNVLVRTKVDRRFVLFRQSKYALPEETLAPVGGFVEDGESPLDAAKRELLEELGLRSLHWTTLGNFVTSANRGGGRIYCFLADQAIPVSGASSNLKDHEVQTAVWLSRAGLLKALVSGRIGEVKWAATVALALLSTGVEHAPTSDQG
jgi:ADP-ribose pyrophosphatase YjhB (NUDIX family)